MVSNLDKFTVTKTNLGDFQVYRVYAEAAGVINFTADPTDEIRATPTRISVVTSGARSYGALDSDPVVQTIGDFNIDLPNKMSGVTYKITALEPNTEYHCISRVDSAPFNFIRVTADAGESLVLQAGQNLFIGGGRVSGADAPTVVYKTDEERTLDVEANMFGLIFW
jgi:hypothetical protein